MSYQEKRVITTMTAGGAVLGAYLVNAAGYWTGKGFAPDELPFWAGTILKFILAGVIATVVIQIVFHILMSVGIAVKESLKAGKSDDEAIEKSIKQEMVEDERDKLIELKAMRIGFIIAGAGFVFSLIAAFTTGSPALMLNILFITFSAGSLAEGAAQLVFYKRGIRHG